MSLYKRDRQSRRNRPISADFPFAPGFSPAASITGSRQDMLKSISTTLVALLIAAIGGTSFYFLHLPLPWTLGAITAAAITAVMEKPYLVPAKVRNSVRPVIGVLIGSSFNPNLVASIGTWWPVVLVVISYSIILMILGYFFFRRVAKFDQPTAFFASAPGGLGELSLLGGALGGDVRRLVIVHLIRILAVIFVVPIVLQIYVGHPIGRISPLDAHTAYLTLRDWLVLGLCACLGYWISTFFKFPAATMLCPMVLSMLVHVTGITQAAPPPWLVAGVQVALGAVIGARFSGIRLGEIHKVFLVAVTWASVMLVAAGLAAFCGAWLLGRSFESVLLATAPAGMVEMSLLTFGLGIDVAFVITCQLSRVLFVLLFTPFVFRMLGVPPAEPKI